MNEAEAQSDRQTLRLVYLLSLQSYRHRPARKRAKIQFK